MNYCVIIPARYASSRLPGKPLINLNGVPMIVRTYQQCLKACPEDRLYVATDDERIKKTCEEYNIKVLMTSSDCLTGTDRIAECSTQLDAEVFINVQGDEPLFNPEDLKTLIESVEMFPNEVINGYCEIKNESLFRNPSIPKVVFRPDGRLLYMSRSSIPTSKNLTFIKSWRMFCAYEFRRKALLDFASISKKTTLENIEDIEILRFLELGWEVRMLKLSDTSIAVDTYDDVTKVEEEIKLRLANL